MTLRAVAHVTLKQTFVGPTAAKCLAHQRRPGALPLNTKSATQGRHWLQSKASKEPKPQMTFPGKSSGSPQVAACRGCFDQLKLCCRLASPSPLCAAGARPLHLDGPNDGLFVWGANVINGLPRSKLSLALEEKKPHVAGCLCELGCSLVISLANNAPHSAGFESFLGGSHSAS